MKANRKFVQADEAVSPVIAVILMVAITVVLAATVFVLVQDLGTKQSVAPAFSMSTNEVDDRLEVVRADAAADWNGLEVASNTTQVRYRLNNEAGNVTGGTLLSTANSYSAANDTTTSRLMDAGDFLDFCGTLGYNTNNTKVTIRNVQANQVMGEFIFKTMSNCSAT